MQRLLREFESREIQLKDLERGLIDFPAIIGGREVFLCWEQDEDDIEFWHDLETGYAGRERLKQNKPSVSKPTRSRSANTRPLDLPFLIQRADDNRLPNQ